MIKRNGLKTIMTILILIVLLIISTLPVLAASHVSEVDILDGDIVQIKNSVNQEYDVTVKILYQDKNGNTIYEKKVKNRVEPFGTTTIDAKDYYNSEKSQKVLAEITKELNLEKTRNILLIIGISFGVIALICFFIARSDEDEGVILKLISILALTVAIACEISWQLLDL
mgnify:FL=1